MKSKLEVSSSFPMFHKLVNTRFEAKIHTLGSDNDKEYSNQEGTCYLEREGILHHTSCVDTP